MILYHFTSRELLPKVERDGITKCKVPWTLDQASGKVQMMAGLQWLTEDPEFDTQSWVTVNQYAAHLQRKSDWRIMVQVPRLAEFKVVRWSELAQKHKLAVADYFDKFPGHRHWRLFVGSIPNQWFVERVQNPTKYELGEIIAQVTAPNG